MRRSGIFPWAALVACIGPGCAGESSAPAPEEPIPVAGAPAAQAPSTSAAGEAPSDELKFEGIRFTLPQGWKRVPIPPEKQGFIDAQLQIQAAGEELTLTLSSIGGGIDANVARWRTQFDSPPDAPPVVELIDVAGRQATWVDLRGTFRASVGNAAAPRSGWRMLGVGIPLEPRDFYLKLIGPEEAVEAVRADLRRFLESARLSP